ncbi:PepSY domain-containing protein [Paraglaciecola sp.]|uniref:PepSY domain-containing protein n=1 Tax=Paraglaciecola sp. TaxID=1920173 RepID=UPI003EF1FBF5
MKSPFYIRLLFSCIISCLIISSDVAAADPKPTTLNKSQAAKKAQQKVNGRVLKVNQSKNKYQVKLLQKSGRVVSVNVDKKSGKVSQQGKKN